MGFLKKKKSAFEGGGLVLFMDVSDAIQGEKVLKQADYYVRLVAPPPEMRRGCDLAIEINLVEQPGIERLLTEKEVAYVTVTPLKAATAEILEVVKVIDFGNWIMVKAANMKLTFDKNSGVIVNTSGGGCPDIPYMHSEMLDKKLDEAPKPKGLGFTLCSLMLDKALDESQNLFQKGK
jgi:hypothetical protein